MSQIRLQPGCNAAQPCGLEAAHRRGMQRVARTAAELAAAINVPVAQAEGVLRDFVRRGIVEPVGPAYALTAQGRELVGGFVAAGEEGFRGAR